MTSRTTERFANPLLQLLPTLEEVFQWRRDKAGSGKQESHRADPLLYETRELLRHRADIVSYKHSPIIGGNC